ETPAAVASRLVERKPVIIYGDLAKAKGEYRRIVFWTFLHELGHAFGLADLYAYPGNEGKAPEYASIMRDMEWAPLVPTKTDLERVRERIKTSGLCDHLLD
ncbi:MAG: hypothetical protein HY075_13735, partial [Deltaproteobacteria bacterium]|nr:hypothetical protein [Deltaproteobacteria bacterium]